MKFRIALLLLALAAILVAAGCNDSNYSANAADNGNAVETVKASTDTDVAAPAENPCAVEGEAKEGCSSCSGCAGSEKAAKDGVETTDASMTEGTEGKTCHDGSSCEGKTCEGKDGVVATNASHEHAEGECCGDCEGKDCGDCEDKEGCDGCEHKDGVETTKASHSADSKDCECEDCAHAA